MNISSYQSSLSSATTFPSSKAYAALSSINSQNSYYSCLTKMMNAIDSGDQANAQQQMAALNTLSSSNASDNASLNTFLDNASEALSNNDMAAAQQALQTFKESAVDTTSTSTTDATFTNASDSTLNELSQGMVALFNSVWSGNLSDAQSAYSHLAAVSSQQSDLNTTVASNEYSTGISFNTLLQNIGSSLNSGDIDSAQSALNSFIKDIATGTLASTTA